MQLAAAYEAAGRHGDSIKLYERALADAERELGQTHRDTLSARVSLARRVPGRGPGARGDRRVPAGARRHRADGGRGRPGRAGHAGRLASGYRAAGKTKEAIACCERVLADRERLSGRTTRTRSPRAATSAYIYRTAGRLKDAIPQYEQRGGRQGTAAAPRPSRHAGLAGILGCRLPAGPALRRGDQPPTSGSSPTASGCSAPGDIDTLTTRCNLATAYYEAGRLDRQGQGAPPRARRLRTFLVADHPMTDTVGTIFKRRTQECKPRKAAHSWPLSLLTTSSLAAVRRERARGPAVGRPNNPGARARGGPDRTTAGTRSSTCPRRSTFPIGCGSTTGSTSPSPSPT